MKRILIYILLMVTMPVWGVGSSGMYQYSVALSGYISAETGKAPTAYLWIPEGCQQVKAVVFAQQNMTEEMLFKNPQFRQQMQQLDVALLWVAPWFTQNWDPSTGCQQVFEEMMTAIAYQSNHLEIVKCPVIPFGHSAQATFPWNFAAWNPERTLCIVSFHGDAPRTNLCGYGTANVEWGRTRNIDGIPGLMIEGEYEWWEARVRPALAFRMMYPNSCISFLCDTGSGHFECMPETAEYIAKFIRKAFEQRLQSDGSLRKLDPHTGWLACRYNPDLQPNDGDGAKDDVFAAYGLGRWLYYNAPTDTAMREAEELFLATKKYIPDALAAYAMMWRYGETKENMMDVKESNKLLQAALKRGSERAAQQIARSRISGRWQ